MSGHGGLPLFHMLITTCICIVNFLLFYRMIFVSISNMLPPIVTANFYAFACIRKLHVSYKLQSEGIYMVDPLSNPSNLRKPMQRVKVMSVDGLKRALRSI